MSPIVSAHAYSNNEVAFLAWRLDQKIPGCLGFQITRIYVDQDGNALGKRRILASWVPFTGQRNPKWEPQDTSVWPIQKMWWRDLTLRRKRDSSGLRPSEVWIKYEIRPVGPEAAGKPSVPVPATTNTYEGKPRPLSYYGDGVETNVVHVTARFGPVAAAFTNGFLSAQWIRNVFHTPPGKSPSPHAVRKAISEKANSVRAILTGDVLGFLLSLVERASTGGGTLYAALYELDDQELIDALGRAGSRLHLILSNTGQGSAGKPAPVTGDGPKPKPKKIWDAENVGHRKPLRDLGVKVQDRLFNNDHIGHNKFVVYVDPQGNPTTVLTGSTNWTPTGLCGQTNNALLIESPEVASDYKAYWDRLHKDKIHSPKPAGSGGSLKTNVQGQILRVANMTPRSRQLPDGGHLDLWCSPNTKATSKNENSPPPPDLAAAFALMRLAKEAILFLTFNPARFGNQSIILEAMKLAKEDKSLLVLGAISDPSAIPNYIVPPKPKKGDKKKKVDQPAIFVPPGAPDTLFIRAAALQKNTVKGDFNPELLTLGHAIIHDKIVVIDPLSPDCAVLTGSHNLGYKASYGNDENLVIIRGNQALAQAYAVHVLDVYDHYKFRAIQLERAQKKQDLWSGFLVTNDRWQDHHFTGTPSPVDYFAR